MIKNHDTAGVGADSPIEVPAAGWCAILRRVWKETDEDNIGLIAAGIAFYAFSAIVPLFAAVVLSYGLFADPETIRGSFEIIFSVLPRDAASVISDQLINVLQTSKDKQGFGLAVALAIAFYGASKGAAAIIEGLNIAYEVREQRGFLKLRLVQLGIVVGGIVLFGLATLSISIFGFLESLIPDAPEAALTLLRITSYVAMAILVITGAAILFQYGPDHRKQAWIWLSPGSAAATLAWLGATAAFSFYAANFGNYGATYGSLSAVIVLLTWLWLSAFVFLLGAELNSETERQGCATRAAVAV